MSRRELEIGTLVRCAGIEAGQAAADGAYRIEQLLSLGDGGRLYKIRSDAEPFDRVVAERQLTRNPLTSPT